MSSGNTDICLSDSDCDDASVKLEDGNDDDDDDEDDMSSPSNGSDHIDIDGDCSDDDEKSDPELSETMQKHREMIREMKKKHRVSASLLRRGELHHQIQHSYQAFMNGIDISCSTSFSFDQFSFYSSHWSMPAGSPNKRNKAVLSPSFSKVLEDTTRKEFSWKEGNLAESFGQYDDEDFSRLFHNDQQRQPKTPQSLHNSTGLTDELEDTDDENDKDEFFDSLEVLADDEEGFVDAFFEFLPTRESKKHHIVGNSCHPATMDYEKDDETGTFFGSSPIATKLFAHNIYTNNENSKEENIEDFVDTFSDSQSLQEDSEKGAFPKSAKIDEDSNEECSDICTISKGTEIEKNKCGSLFPFENGDVKSGDFVKTYSHLEPKSEKNGPQKRTDNLSCVGAVNEDRREHSVDTAVVFQVPTTVDNAQSNGSSSPKENEEDGNEEFIDSFSCAKSLQKNLEEETIQDAGNYPSLIATFPAIPAITIEERAGKSVSLPHREHEDDCSQQNRGKDTNQDKKIFTTLIENTEEDASGDFAHTCTSHTSNAEEYVFKNASKHATEKNDSEDSDGSFSHTFSIRDLGNEIDNKSFDNTDSTHQSALDSKTDLKLPPSIENIQADRCIHPFGGNVEAQMSSISDPSLRPDDVIPTPDQNRIEDPIAGSVASDSVTCSIPLKTHREKMLMQGESNRDPFQRGVSETKNAFVSQSDSKGEHAKMDDNDSNKSLGSDEDRQKIDSILDGFFEELNTINGDPAAKMSPIKAEETSYDYSLQRNITEESVGEEPGIEVACCEEKTVPMQDSMKFSEGIPSNLQHEPNNESARASEQIDSYLGVPTPIKNEVKEIDAILDDFLRTMDDRDNADEDNYHNCTEDDIEAFPQLQMEPFNCLDEESLERPEAGQDTKAAAKIIEVSSIEGLTSYCDKNYTSFETLAVSEGDEAKTNRNLDATSKNETDALKNTRASDIPSQQLSDDHKFTNSSIRKLEIRSRATSLIKANSFSSDYSPTNSPVRFGENKSDFTSPARAIGIKDDFQSDNERQIDQSTESLSREMRKSKMKADFVVQSFTPLNDSRITSPELNQSLGDDSGVFLSTPSDFDALRPSDPVATALSQDSSECKIDCVGKSALNTPITEELEQGSAWVNDPIALSRASSDGSTVHESAITNPNDNDSANNGQPLYAKGSVSTISASSLPSSKVEKVDASARAPITQLEPPILFSYSCDSEQSPVEINDPDDANKSFSIASPPPIPKKESKLVEVLGDSASEKPPKAPQSATPVRSNPTNIPFHRTRDRLSKESPSRRRRERSRNANSPHRVETSRSPLFFDRDGKPSTGDSVVSWYTSPSRSSSPATSIQLSKSNHRKNQERSPIRGCSSNHSRSTKESSLSGTKLSRKASKRSPIRSDTTQTTMSSMITYASPNRSMVSSMRSPLRSFHSLADPPRSPAVSLFSRMPRGARSAIRKSLKKSNNYDTEDLLSVDTVRVCTNKFGYKIHPTSGPCARCWAMASPEEREIFQTRGSHLRIAKTRSGCSRSCAIFPPEGKNGAPVRLCRPCFFATHQHGDGSCRLQMYRGNHIKVRPTR